MLENPFLFWMDKLYGFFVSIGSNLQSLFLLYMRITWGHQFFIIGSAKLENITSTIQGFAQLGIWAPEFHAYFVGISEMVGGLLLIVGFASRLAAIPLIGIMIAALSTAHAEHLKNFQFVLDPTTLAGESPYPFLITTLMILTFGAGRISIDAWIKRWVSHQPKY